MPNANRTQPIWLPQGTPDNTCIASVDYNAMGGQPGDLGQAFDYNTRTYQRVKLDSGSTAATPAGAPAAGDLLYWKDQTNYLVTSDRRMSINMTNDGYRNAVAGVLRFTPTAAQIAAESYIDVLQRGTAISVASDGNGVAGAVAVAEAGANNRITAVNAGTAPTCIPVGVIAGTPANNAVAVNVNITNIP